METRVSNTAYFAKRLKDAIDKFTAGNTDIAFGTDGEHIYITNYRCEGHKSCKAVYETPSSSPDFVLQKKMSQKYGYDVLWTSSKIPVEFRAKKHEASYKSGLSLHDMTPLPIISKSTLTELDRKTGVYKENISRVNKETGVSKQCEHKVILNDFKTSESFDINAAARIYLSMGVINTGRRGIELIEPREEEATYGLLTVPAKEARPVTTGLYDQKVTKLLETEETRYENGSECASKVGNARVLNAYILFSPRVPEEIIVYRGAKELVVQRPRSKEEILKDDSRTPYTQIDADYFGTQFQVGEMVKFSGGFTSTSFSPSVAAKFSEGKRYKSSTCCFFQFVLPAEYPGIYLTGAYGGEYEFLLPALLDDSSRPEFLVTKIENRQVRVTSEPWEIDASGKMPIFKTVRVITLKPTPYKSFYDMTSEEIDAAIQQIFRMWAKPMSTTPPEWPTVSELVDQGFSAQEAESIQASHSLGMAELAKFDRPKQLAIYQWWTAHSPAMWKAKRDRREQIERIYRPMLSNCLRAAQMEQQTDTSELEGASGASA